MILVLVVASGAYAFANSVNNVGPLRLGSGSGNISKYSVSDLFNDITYNLNADSPQNIDSVTIELVGASAATSVRIQLLNGGLWYSTCDSSAAPIITCTTTGATATAVNGGTLRIVAKG